MLRLLLTALLMVVVPAPVAAMTSPLVATFGRDGRVTRDEVQVYGYFISSPHADPFSAYTTAPNDAARAEPAYFIDRATTDIIWNAHYAGKARAEGKRVPLADAAQIATTTLACYRQAYLTHRGSSQSTVTAEQLRAAFERYQQQFQQPETRDVSYIFMRPDESNTTAALAARLEQIRREITSGSISFAEAALRYSHAASAANGGAIGLVTKESAFNPRVLHAIFSQPPKQFSPVLELHNGLYLFYIKNVIPAATLSWEDVQSSPALQQRVVFMVRADLLKAAETELQAMSVEAQRKNILQSGADVSKCDLLTSLAEQRVLAYNYISPRYAKAWEPTEEEIRAYYEANPTEMMEQGQFQLTKFTVPISSTPASGTRSGEDVMRVAAAIREHVAAGKTDDELRASFASERLSIQKTYDWALGSGNAKADAELLKMTQNGLTSVYLLPEGAQFFRLDDRRTPKKLPLAQKKDYIAANVRAKKTNQWLAEDQQRVLRMLNTRIVWR